MVGKSPITADGEQRAALRALAHSRDRCEADRARAMLLTLLGWTSPRIAEAFGVREDTVRLWRCDFADGGVEALKASVAPGPAPCEERGRAARRPRLFWQLPSPTGAIETIRAPDQRDRGAARSVRIGRSAIIQDAAKKNFPLAAAAAQLERSPESPARSRAWACAFNCARPKPKTGDIVLLYGDESEALTHPYLARAWAKRGADLRVPAAGTKPRKWR